MAYSNFNLRQVEKDFHLQIEEQIDLFAHIKAITPSDEIKKLLAENIPLALAINTEKARSEFLIAPTLLELRRRSPVPISLFSGTEIYGIVTTGEIWKFLQITEQTVAIDLTDYYITDIGKILGILLNFVTIKTI